MPSRAPFPATAWTQVLTAQTEAPESRDALEDICKAYWPAIYTYLRALGCEREEARHFTQEFLALPQKTWVSKRRDAVLATVKRRVAEPFRRPTTIPQPAS